MRRLTRREKVSGSEERGSPQVEKLEGRERADRGGERGEAAARQVEAGQARGGQSAVLDGGEKASGALGRGLPGLEPGRGVRLVGCHGGRAEGAGAIDGEVPMRTRCQRGADPARASEAKTTRRARMRDERRREDAEQSDARDEQCVRRGSHPDSSAVASLGIAPTTT